MRPSASAAGESISTVTPWGVLILAERTNTRVCPGDKLERYSLLICEPRSMSNTRPLPAEGGRSRTAWRESARTHEQPCHECRGDSPAYEWHVSSGFCCRSGVRRASGGCRTGFAYSQVSYSDRCCGPGGAWRRARSFGHPGDPSHNRKRNEE